MLYVKTPEEVLNLIHHAFSPVAKTETVSLENAMGRVLAEDISATEYVPDFDRSTVDGYAVRANDTFGCTDAIPAILSLQGEVLWEKVPDLLWSQEPVPLFPPEVLYRKAGTVWLWWNIQRTMEMAPLAFPNQPLRGKI